MNLTTSIDILYNCIIGYMLMPLAPNLDEAKLCINHKHSSIMAVVQLRR